MIDDTRQEPITASYAHLQLTGDHSDFTEQATFWNRPPGMTAILEAAIDAEQDSPQAVTQAATWWPVVLIVLLCGIAGVALFG